jgi:hypothetical protein
MGATRRGFHCTAVDESHIGIGEYFYDISNPDAPIETWWQGVTVFENPNALFPLQKDILPRSSTFHVINGDLAREIHEFHPLTSFLNIFPLDDDKGDDED